MGQGLATIIIEQRALLREALVSMMAIHSYRVIGAISTTADIGKSLVVEGPPKLVILGALRPMEATAAATTIRGLWAEAKIIFLFEDASPADLQSLWASEIDGCIPLSASRETFLGTLKHIVHSGLRILVRGSAKSLSMPCPLPWDGEGSNLSVATDNLPVEAASRAAFVLACDRTGIAAGMSKKAGNGGNESGAFSIRNFHRLSDREEEIVRGLLKGHSNKVIARTFGLSEATVKVHMKSILKKIRVTNRTQAALWALRNV